MRLWDRRVASYGIDRSCAGTAAPAMTGSFASAPAQGRDSVVTHVVAVTFNPAVDRTLTVTGPLEGTVRATDEAAVPGGKGINVARVARTLGADVSTLGIVGGHTGRWMVEGLVDEGLDPRFVESTGETRTTIAVYGPAHDELTLVERGPERTPADLQRLLERLESLFDTADVVVASGSCPRGVDHAYAELVAACHRVQCPVLVDTSGDFLRHALAERPTVTKVTADEARTLIDREVATEELPAALVAAGSSLAIVTLGADGAIASDGNERWRVGSPSVPDARPVGSGDAFAAGFVLAWLDDGGVEDALRAGAAAGAANAASGRAGVVDADEVARLRRTMT